jgi:hypothetical protein
MHMRHLGGKLQSGRGRLSLPRDVVETMRMRHLGRRLQRGRGRQPLRLQAWTLLRLAVALDPRLPPRTLLLRPIQLRAAHARGRHLAGVGKLLAVLLLAHLRRCMGQGWTPWFWRQVNHGIPKGAMLWNSVW